MMHSLSRVRQFRVELALGLVVAGLISAGAVLASTTGWTVQPSPTPRGSDQLVGVAATSRTNAWAVGYSGEASLVNQIRLVERWNGKTWNVQKSPHGGLFNTALNGVAATSATNAWAVGEKESFDSGHPVAIWILHWNGTGWKVQHAPNPAPPDCCPGNVLQGVAATSATDAWAVGYDQLGGTRPKAVIEHWNGKGWKVQNPNAGHAILNGVAATSSTNAWAVGSSVGRTLIEHWNGKAWTIQPSANPGRKSSLSGVVATSATNAWAVGSYRTPHHVKTLIEHWNGKAWKVQPSANPRRKSSLSGVVATSATNAWAVGSYFSGHTRRTLIEHWGGKAWKVQPSADPTAKNSLSGVAATSATNAWAVGSSGKRTLVEHWNGKG